MFRCAITGKVSKSGEAAIKLVVATRPRIYLGPKKEEDRDGKLRIVRDDNGDVVMTEIGRGTEVVKEITVTQEGYDKYMGNTNG